MTFGFYFLFQRNEKCSSENVDTFECHDVTDKTNLVQNSFVVSKLSSGHKVEDPYPFGGRSEATTPPQQQQPNGFFDSYFVSYTAAKIAGWGNPSGPYHPGPPHMSHHPGGGMKDGPPGYPPHPQLMDMYSGVSPATAINTMDWKNTSQVRPKTYFYS